VQVAPHNPLGPLATMVNIHFSASTPNFLILEYIADDHSARRDLVKEPIVLKDGYLELPTAPGLGIDVDEKEAAKHPFQQEPLMRYFQPDGSVADW